MSKQENSMGRYLGAALLSLMLSLMHGLAMATETGGPESVTTEEETNATEETFNEDEIFRDASHFFGKGAKGLAKVVERIFQDRGQPNGYIKGEEGGGAFVVGLRYGKGELILKNGAIHKVYWQSPSVGFDFGGNIAKTFILVYHLPSVEALFQRFPGVDGSLYVVGGVGVNYARSGKIILAPMRLGVGFRAGAAASYVHFTKEKRVNPF